MHVRSSFLPGGVAILTLATSQKHNILSEITTKELDHQLNLMRDDHTVRCVVLTGSATNFCVGADLKELNRYASAQEIKAADPLALWSCVERFEKPIIAAVAGYCLGGGLELAMMCDMIISTPSAVFAQPEIKLGLMPGAGGTQRLARQVGKARAMELCLTGRFFTAQEALAWGLVVKIVGEEKLLDEAVAFAENIAAKSAPAVSAVKACIRNAEKLSLQEGLYEERQRFYSLFDTEGQKEGMRAFLKKEGKK